MPQEYKLLLKHADEAGYTIDLECYERHGGYAALRQSLAMKATGETTPQAPVRKSVLASGLRGRGGAEDIGGGQGGDPAGTKAAQVVNRSH